MARLPRRFGPLIYGAIQAAVTTGIATAITTYQLSGFGAQAFARWVVAWLVAWAAMLPVVILVSRLLQRAVSALTRDGRT